MEGGALAFYGTLILSALTRAASLVRTREACQTISCRFSRVWRSGAANDQMIGAATTIRPTGRVCGTTSMSWTWRRDTLQHWHHSIVQMLRRKLGYGKRK